ncbi:LptF/LptG family permease [Chlorobaculum sp. MV4-Y]|uniref:LptF/LptG family permease n=1 Tax=Chlorobaculum sp. MV4-Y TaxID=2976335 RepID=UPI0021AFC9F6|nr:LptF/LptG family permease [Chlorobaculum sp. MV4-Y]UWX56946.1 LptF/LptG family permease [Chlorobaculum sp. MV4-Y]
MKIFDRYILKEHLGTFFFAFVTIMFVFILSFLTQFLERLIGKGLDFRIILEVVALQSAWMVGLAVPMAVLVSTVMAFSSLTNSSELTVMRSGGISIYRLVAPVLLAALALSLMMERFNNVLMPEANYKANALFADITRMKPGLGIDKNAFSDVIQGYSIMVRDIDNETGELRDIVLYDRGRPDVRTVIMAARGRIQFSHDYSHLVLTLEDGQIHELSLPAMDRYRKMVFAKNRYVFDATGYGFERTDDGNRRRGGKELSAADLLSIAREFRLKGRVAESSIDKEIAQLKKDVAAIRNRSDADALLSPSTLPPAVTGRAIEFVDTMIGNVSLRIEQMQQNRKAFSDYMIEYHKKYSLAFACLVFAVVGAPLGVMARRGGFGAGAALSLFFFVLYWVLLIGGEKIAERGLLLPAISVWLPNVVLAVTGLFMMYRLSSSASDSGR